MLCNGWQGFAAPYDSLRCQKVQAEACRQKTGERREEMLCFIFCETSGISLWETESGTKQD